MGMRIFIVAGDRSGDAHAARLMQAIRQREPDVEFVGLGGPAMEAVGLRSILPFATMNVSGFWEVLRRYRILRAAFESTLNHCLAERYDAFIPVDYPGFNLPLARRLRACGTPVFWYIAPQLWAWGRWRARRLAEAVDRLFVVFPFEVDFFRRAGIEAEWYGHPFLDNPAYMHEPSVEKQPNLIALLPGTRQHERNLHLSLFLRVADRLRRRHQQLEFAVACEQPPEIAVPESVRFTPNVEQLLLNAGLAVVKAGTSSLEAMLAGAAEVVVYRASIGTYLIARSLIRIPYVALPNIIAGRQIVPEVVQWTNNVRRIEEQVEYLIAHPDEQHRQRDEARRLRLHLGSSGVSQRIADRMLTLLGRR